MSPERSALRLPGRVYRYEQLPVVDVVDVLPTIPTALDVIADVAIMGL